MSFLTTLFRKEQRNLLPRSDLEIAILDTNLKHAFEGPEYDLPLPLLFEKLLQQPSPTDDVYRLNIAYALEEVYNAAIHQNNEELTSLYNIYLFPVLERMRQAARYMGIHAPDISTFYARVCSYIDSSINENESFVFRLLFSSERISVVVSEMRCTCKKTSYLRVMIIPVTGIQLKEVRC